MIGPVAEIALVFVVGLIFQMLMPSHRVGVAIGTTIIPFLIMILTVGWKLWDQDALWIVGYVMTVVEYAAASIASGLIAWGVKRSLPSA